MSDIDRVSLAWCRGNHPVPERPEYRGAGGVSRFRRKEVPSEGAVRHAVDHDDARTGHVVEAPLAQADADDIGRMDEEVLRVAAVGVHLVGADAERASGKRPRALSAITSALPLVGMIIFIVALISEHS